MSEGTYSLSVGGFIPKLGTFTLESDRPMLGYVLRNYERLGMSRPTQNQAPVDILGLPDTCKLVQPTFVSMTEDMQWFWFEQLVRFAPSDWTTEQLKQAWRSLTNGGRAFTNKHGWNNGYADYINGANLDASPMAFEPIVCGGNVVALVSGHPTQIGGSNCYEIYTLDPIKDPSTYPLDPWYLYRATISRREGYNSATNSWAREDLEIRFSQLGGANDVPVPLWSKTGRNYIGVGRIRILKSDEPIPEPYVF